MFARSDLFSSFGPPAKAKLLVLGPLHSSLEVMMAQARSLNFEHVSPAALMQQEISRRTSLGISADRANQRGTPVADEIIFAVMRRWFWTRKPDAGFILTDFPATLLQAKVFDEWLDARDETLDGVFVFDSGLLGSPLVEHYRTSGLIVDSTVLAA